MCDRPVYMIGKLAKNAMVEHIFVNKRNMQRQKTQTSHVEWLLLNMHITNGNPKHKQIIRAAVEKPKNNPNHYLCT